jgi:outer membrane protein TolC
LSIPISNRWANRSRVKLAKINVSESVNQLQQQKLNLYKEIQTALQKSEALFAEKEANGHNLEAKEMAYTIAKKKYEKGLINIYDLQQVKNVWTMAKIEQVRVAIQLKIQQKTIDFYNGNPVFEVN